MNKFLQLKESEVEGKRIILKQLRVSDVTYRYVDWLNDSRVNHFLSSGNIHHEFNDVEEYVRSYEGANTKLLLGIYDRATELHIGNVTFSHIDWEKNVGAIGIAIGDVSYWGKGYATEALKLGVDFAFLKLKLCKLVAGIHENNEASKKLFIKLGFIREGTPEDKRKYEIGDDGVMFVLGNRIKQRTRQDV